MNTKITSAERDARLFDAGIVLDFIMYGFSISFTPPEMQLRYQPRTAVGGCIYSRPAEWDMSSQSGISLSLHHLVVSEGEVLSCILAALFRRSADQQVQSAQ